VFVLVERGVSSPLIEVSIFKIRPFFVENLVLGVSNLVFIPVFFFASEYAQIGLGKSASSASLVLLYFFAGFVVAAQIGGRMLDRIGAKRPVVLGCALAVVGYWLWASRVTDLDFGKQVWCVILAGAGTGFMLGPASTDAVNRASRLSYGEATGITQTVRNYAASLGLAVLGSLLVSQLHSRLTTSLVARGLPHAQASAQASHLSQSGSQAGTGAIPQFVRLDFAYATRSVLYAMAAIMAVATVVALVGLKRGVQAKPDAAPAVAEG
jgi:fucose permease